MAPASGRQPTANTEIDRQQTWKLGDSSHGSWQRAVNADTKVGSQQTRKLADSRHGSW